MNNWGEGNPFAVPPNRIIMYFQYTKRVRSHYHGSWFSGVPGEREIFFPISFALQCSGRTNPDSTKNVEGAGANCP